jgi:peptidyl-prolyl cis-trans isomerase SurA
MRQRVANGEDFEKVAKSKGGSDDPSVRDNGGDLGWFSAFQMIYSFEDAAFRTPVGELSNIVRTRYGYHVLEVTGRRDARGEIRTAHIMIRTKDGASEEELTQAENRIGQVYDLLQNGLPWEESEPAKWSKTLRMRHLAWPPMEPSRSPSKPLTVGTS